MQKYVHKYAQDSIVSYDLQNTSRFSFLKINCISKILLFLLMFLTYGKKYRTKKNCFRGPTFRGKTYILMNFKVKSCRDIQNLYQNCWMNAILQVVCGTTIFYLISSNFIYQVDDPLYQKICSGKFKNIQTDMCDYSVIQR